MMWKLTVCSLLPRHQHLATMYRVVDRQQKGQKKVLPWRVSRQGPLLDERTVSKAVAVTFTKLGNFGLANTQTREAIPEGDWRGKELEDIKVCFDLAKIRKANAKLRSEANSALTRPGLFYGIINTQIGVLFGR